MDIQCGYLLANSIIILAKKEHLPLTYNKLNYLVYLVYSEYIYQTNKQIFNEPFVKTETGPVVPSNYAKFGMYGNVTISNLGYDSVGKSYYTIGRNFNKYLIITFEKFKYCTELELLEYINQGKNYNSHKVDDIITPNEILEDQIQHYETELKSAYKNLKNQNN